MPSAYPVAVSQPRTLDPPAPQPTAPVPRVLFVVDALSNNGAVSITIDLARRWAGAGARLLVLSSAEQTARIPADAPVEQLAPGARLRAAVLTGLPRLLRRAAASDVVVGASEIGPGLLLGFLAARFTRRPFVVAVHADLDDALQEWVSPRLHRLSYWVHRHADGALAVAPALVDPLVRNGLPASKVRVIRNGIDVAAVRAAANGPGSLVSGRSVPVVVATGRLAPQKGYDLLIRAHARVVDRYPHEVLVLNDGPELAALQQLAAELGVSATVRFAGSEVPPLPSVADADLFCLPSRHEGLPLALLEAVALGVPVVAADCAEGVRVALDAGRVGRLVPVEDVDALAQALADHLADQGALRTRAALGPAHADGFDRSVMADGWARALGEFLAPRR